jgi:hypothetical protein
MLIVLVLAFQHSFLSPSMEEQDQACARKCQAEGYSGHEFTRPGVSNPKSDVVPMGCRCIR